MEHTITSFSDRYRFLSNFWPVEIIDDGILYPSSEHMYQAAKMANRKDRIFIAEQSSPGKAKRLGRLLPLRSDWDDIKIDTMREIIRKKFAHPGLAQALLGTHDSKLQEGNTWGDTFWGVCQGEGENHLGKLLMEIREEIRNE